MVKERKTVVMKLFGSIYGEREARDNGDEGTFVKISASINRFYLGDNSDRQQWDPLLLISSRGGNTEAALCLYGLLKQLPQPLTALGFGQVDSAAIFVYLAAQKRLAVPSTTFMMHAGTYSMVNVSTHEVMANAKECKLKAKIQAEIIAERCNVSLSRVKKWINDGKSFSAEEAKRYGIVHEIVKDSIFKEMGEVLSIDSPWE